MTGIRLSALVEISARLSETPGRKDKISLLADGLRRMTEAEVAIGVAYLAGQLPQGRIGVGPSALRQARPGSPADSPSLALVEVDAAFDAIAAASGPGSTAARIRLLGRLLARATAAEQTFLMQLITGELRQGALDGLAVEAIAKADGVPARAVRRALMLAGDLPTVARLSRRGGAAALANVGLELFRPLQPMLASPAEDAEAALASLGQAALEFKLDGARIQAHKDGETVRVYSRQLHEVTAAVPEVVEAVRGLDARRLVLDGEVIALRPDGRPHPFQTTMRRFGRRLDIDRMRTELPLSPVFFDCLQRDDQPLIDAPTGERHRALSELAPDDLRIPRIVTADPAEATRFLARAIAAGHEGLMAKALDAAYQAGGRGKQWFKVKPVHTLDLVVLAAEWGHGRRQGWLSNLHLGARDPDSGGFVMLGKTFKGLTDALLTWQTEQLLTRELGREGHVVHVRPELVVEIAVNELQASPRYPGGLALRFARVKRYRTDKTAAEADTIATVRRIHREGLSAIGG